MTEEKHEPPELTDEQREALAAYTDGFGGQDENGVDLSLLRENLKRTPTERLEQLRRELLFFHEVRYARTRD